MNFTTSIVVDQRTDETLRAIQNMRGWWSEEIEGRTDKVGDVFHYHYKDVHRCTMELTELVPGKRVVWLVTDNDFNFVEDKSEWIGTRVIFDLSDEGGKTLIRFTHEGLVPAYECFEVCQNAWTGYISKSLRDLIATGKGAPNPKEPASV
ncbi:SRPBCC family protein [Dinghuibacter silviterrae]|uniref:Activator of Hsp90 ATPase-like protein n=1 Tax=Dinghuibacter silviterrae TaxID=1539049 RepID=A0A4R8DVM0_9BACT|nr:SRPBCC domain-containing protein [Dinghuibacter silviterrae]TDX02086.1 activator of Hsp90 ATPase-like protein [Dinghuibacter silviterrae]